MHSLLRFCLLAKFTNLVRTKTDAYTWGGSPMNYMYRASTRVSTGEHHRGAESAVEG